MRVFGAGSGPLQQLPHHSMCLLVVLVTWQHALRRDATLPSPLVRGVCATGLAAARVFPACR
eukprot:12725945-Alexandrium_andersonii.AAC.1